MFAKVSGLVSELRHFERQNGDRVNVVELSTAFEVQLPQDFTVPQLYSQAEYNVKVERSQYGLRLTAVPDELVRAMAGAGVNGSDPRTVKATST